MDINQHSATAEEFRALFDPIEAVLRLREAHPVMGKEKLRILLAQERVQTSTSTVGRLLNYLKRRGYLGSRFGMISTTKNGAWYAPTQPENQKNMSR